MAFVFNASNVEQSTQVHGSWFTFKPKQIKQMSDEKVFFLVSKRSEQGFMALPQEFEDPAFQTTEEGKRILKEAEATGIANRIQFLEWLKNNELSSLARDAEKKNLKYDTRIEITPAVATQLEELAAYRKQKKQEANAGVERIKQLESALTEE